MEFVFTSMLSLEKLISMVSDLITNVYKELSSDCHVRYLIRSFNYGGCECVDEETMQNLVIYMTRTYCRMRGKDFIQKFMQHGFKNKNS